MNKEEMKIFKLISRREDFILKLRSELEDICLNDIISYWKKNKHYDTSIIDELLQSNIIPQTFADNKSFTVGGFRHIRHQAVMDYVKAKSDWDNNKKDRITTCYIGLIKWLDYISFGWFRANITSYQISPHAMKKTLTFSDWRGFIETLYGINQRDELIARTLLQGQKRVSEVLGLTLNQVDFENNTIHYKSKETSEIVCYEVSFMKELKEYVNETKKLRKDKKFVFLTRTGKPVTRLRLNYSFAKVCELIGIKKISPDYLRGIYKMFIQQRYKETTIMQSYKNRLEQAKIKREEKIKKYNNEVSN